MEGDQDDQETGAHSVQREVKEVLFAPIRQEGAEKTESDSIQMCTLVG